MKTALSMLCILFLMMLPFTISSTEKWTETEKIDSNPYDYVIITTDHLKNSLKEFAIWKEGLGYSVKIVTLSHINENYGGKNQADKIRNFLIDKYEEWKIKYVLLVGSIRNIPMKFLYADPEHKYCDPSDYYYADLTDNWDSDGDGFPGEYGDDKLTLHPDVYVGRLPFDDPDEIKNYTKKLIRYEMDNGKWKKKALLIGPLTDDEYHCILGGDWWVEPLKNNILRPAGFECITMYEKEGLVVCPLPCDYPLNEKNVVSVWSQGYGLVEWFSHGSEKAAWRVVWHTLEKPDWIPFIQSCDAPLLNDAQPSIVWSHGCLTAKPGCLDNLCYSLLRHGAIITCGATRGWGEYGELGREFNRRIIRGESMGEAFWNAKVYSLTHNKNTPIERYAIVYGMTLHGDPSLYIYLTNRPPLQPSQPFPANASGNIRSPIKLDWADCKDLDGDKVIYDLYLGKTKNLTNENLIASNLTDSEYIVQNLEDNSCYYWRVVAKDAKGLKRSGPIWTFYTVDNYSPTINITFPKKNHIYIFGLDKGRIPFGTIIIGGITIITSTHDNLVIDRVEFYIDDLLKSVKTEEPYCYRWDEKVIGIHTIKVVAYDKSNNFSKDAITVFAII